MYGADLWGNHVTRFSNSGASFQPTYGGTGRPPTAASTSRPASPSARDDTYVADTVNQRMQRFATATGAFEQAIGHRGWEATDLTGLQLATRRHPEHRVSNTIWVADTKNNRLTAVQPAGQPHRQEGGHLGSGADQLHWPFAIASAGADLIVADTFNNRVERWDTSTLTTTWTSAAGAV